MAYDWTKGLLTWFDGDTLYISVVFTWRLPEAKKLAEKSRSYWKVRIGGTATRLYPGFFAGMDGVIEGGDLPGVLQRHNPLATRTTTGCIRKCSFCGVKFIEGPFSTLEDWPDLPVLCDNNLFAAPQAHFDRVIDRLKQHDFCDFNQGVDCRLLTDYHAQRIAECRKPIVRLALDSMKFRDQWEVAFERLRKAGIPKSRIYSYAVIAESSGVDEAWDRCHWIESHKIKALPMWFHGLRQLECNVVTDEQKALGWTDYERRRIMQWFYKHKHAVKSEED